MKARCGHCEVTGMHSFKVNERCPKHGREKPETRNILSDDVERVTKAVEVSNEY